MTKQKTRKQEKKQNEKIGRQFKVFAIILIALIYILALVFVGGVIAYGSCLEHFQETLLKKEAVETCKTILWRFG